ncbi:hypothetical protein [Achromobacter phage nyashin_LB6]|nr:hypothetical protein [Achromobacter phage nyashin_LB6]
MNPFELMFKPVTAMKDRIPAEGKRPRASNKYPSGKTAGRPYEYSRETYVKMESMLKSGLSGRKVATALNVKYDSVRNMQRRIFRGDPAFHPDGKFPEQLTEGTKENG